MSAQVETSVLTLTLPARPEYLMFTRLVLTGLSRSVEIDAEALADLKLAVSEACSYSIRDRAGERLEICYELTSDELAVTVTTLGETGLVTASEAIPDPEHDLGLVIIQALVDELEITRDDASVERISFRKRLERV